MSDLDAATIKKLEDQLAKRAGRSVDGTVLERDLEICAARYGFCRYCSEQSARRSDSRKVLKQALAHASKLRTALGLHSVVPQPQHPATRAGFWWLGRQDSNLRSRDQNPLPYPLATPHGTRPAARYAQTPALRNRAATARRGRHGGDQEIKRSASSRGAGQSRSSRPAIRRATSIRQSGGAALSTPAAAVAPASSA